MTQAQLLVSTVGRSAEGTTPPRYSLLVARDGDEVLAAQRLRHQVFAGEMGATLHTPTPGLDIDAFDEHCDHLVVREDGTGEIVGCYRMLPPERAAAAGMLYSETEFDLRNLAPLRASLVETGRSCVHPDHRSGAVINLMWAGIARYLHLKNLRWLGGCASVPVADGPQTAAGVWELARAKHLSPPALRVRPRRPWLAEPGAAEAVAAHTGRAAVPPLLRGYLRLGAWICGEPAYDADFGVADMYVLLSLDRVDPRYLKHVLGGS
jgi:putative hemolysin